MAAPKKRPDQVRRRNTSLITTLPPDGREGDPPPWPLPGAPTKAEKELWARVWSKPQAVIWESWMAEDLVARYVRLAVRAAKPGAGASLQSEVRQMEVQLGMSPMALFRLQWTLGERQPLAKVASFQEAYDKAPTTEATG